MGVSVPNFAFWDESFPTRRKFSYNFSINSPTLIMDKQLRSFLDYHDATRMGKKYKGIR